MRQPFVYKLITLLETAKINNTITYYYTYSDKNENKHLDFYLKI